MKKYGFLLAVTGLALTLLASWISSNYFSDIVSSHAKLEKRFGGLLNNIDEIAQNSEKKTLFIGTSIYQYFLDPQYFDQQMKLNNVISKSYNLGFEGAVGSGFYSMIARLQGEFKKNGAHFKNIVLELSPACFNQTFYQNHKFVIDVTHPQIFMDTEAWLQMFLKNAPSAVCLLADQIFKPLNWEVLPYRSWLGFGKYRKNEWAGIANLWSTPVFYERPEWNPQSAGLVNWNLPSSEKEFHDMLESMHQEKNWNYMIARYRFGNGIYENFSYESNLVNFYIEAVQLAEKMSDYVTLVILPYAPSFQEHVDRFVSQDYLIRRLSRETKAKILNYTRTLPSTNEDFADAMHLKKENMNRYLKLIADNLAKDQKAL